MTFINPMAYRNSQETGWRGKVEEIRSATDEYNKYLSLMTPAERAIVGDSITKKKNTYYGEVCKGMRADLDQAATAFKGKLTALTNGRQKENASWDSAKLGAEMNTFQTFANMKFGMSGGAVNPLAAAPNVGTEISKLYEEWHSSSDKYKQRAAAEVMRSITPMIDKVKDHNEAARLRMLAKQADEHLKDIRTPNELLDLALEANKAAESLLQKKTELTEIAKLMGEHIDPVFGGGGDMSRLLRTVQVDRKSGQIKIYAPDAPEVTGIYPPSDSDSDSLVIGG